MTAMSLEFYTIIAVAVALAGLILNGHRSLSASLVDMRKELREEFREGLAGLRKELREEFREGLAGLRKELREEFREDIGTVRSELSDLRREFNAFGAQMHKEIAALSERVARLGGLVEGLRDAVTGKAA